MRVSTLIVVISGLVALAGCHTLEPPKDFLVVDRSDLGPYEKRAVSADGVVVGVRTQSNSKGGTLEFWSQALGSELAGSRGYRLVKSQDVKNRFGTPGTLMEFATDYRGSTFSYLLAVYVTDYTVVLAEAGGQADAVNKHREAIIESLHTAH